MLPVLGLLVSILVLQPVLDSPGPLRLASSGTGHVPVEWTLDGKVVASTQDGSASSVEAGTGLHALAAQSDYEGSWSALARSEPREDGIAYVPAWSAHTEGAAPAAASAYSPSALLHSIQGWPLALMIGGMVSTFAFLNLRARHRRGSQAAVAPSGSKGIVANGQEETFAQETPTSPEPCGQPTSVEGIATAQGSSAVLQGASGMKVLRAPVLANPACSIEGDICLCEM